MQRKRRITFNHRPTTSANIQQPDRAASSTDRPTASSRRGHLLLNSKPKSSIQVMSTAQARAGVVPAMPVSNVPSLFTSSHALSQSDAESHSTQTSRKQQDTVAAVLSYLNGTLDGVRPAFNDHGVPALDRENHADFARETMTDKKPWQFTPYDPARPWLVYWACTALGVLGDLGETAENRALRNRAMDTFSAQQCPTGGFGGSHGHLAHIAPTYAAVLSLAMLSGQEDGVDAFRLIDRRALWEWLGQVKQSDGGFCVCVGGEEDVRGAYCSMTIITILNLPLELPPDSPARKAGMTSFTDGLKGWLRRCQTYEGGISGAPDSEAHGAYAFCVLGCLSLIGDPRITIPEVLNVDMLLSWLSSRQHAPEGGFSGRTNKLVDACYSHWVGGCWPLLEAAVVQGTHASTSDVLGPFTQTAATSLYNREGLIRYILCCCQAEDGGLRDKPGVYPDGYHTCYTLAGLSSAQHYDSYQYPDGSTKQSLPAGFGWTPAGPSEERVVSEDVVEPIHPVFVIPFDAVERAKERFKDAAWP